MGKIAVVTDSTADLTTELIEQYGITVVPLTLVIGEETMLDGTLTQEEFFERMNAAPELPTTSQPPVGAFIEVYQKALETASEVVSVHISSKLSGTISSARKAAEEFAGRVHVVDSLQLSWGLGFQALEAGRAAMSEIDASAVVKRVESVRDRVEMIVHVDTVDNLVKGGRISSFAGRVSGMLNVKLSFTVNEEGSFALVRPFRNAQSALKHGLDWVGEHMGDTKRGAFCVAHAMSEDRAEWLRERIEERFDVTEMFVAQTGTVLSTHTGTGWAIAFVPEE